VSDLVWERRLRLPEIGSVRWSAVRPERLAFLSNEGGLAGVWACDLGTGARRRVSGEAIVDLSSSMALVTPDGRAVVWWSDPTGDERGRWIVSPYDGGPDEPLLPGVPDAWSGGISLAGDTIAAGLVGDDGSVVYVARPGRLPEVVLHDELPAGVGREYPPGDGGLSADARLLCVRRPHERDITRPELVVIDLADGRLAGRLSDPSAPLIPEGWSPIPGDERLLVVRETDGRSTLELWDLGDGSVVPVPVDLPGDTARAWWYPDGASLLIHHEHDATPSLLRLDLAVGSLEVLVERGGTIEDAGVRPDGAVWYRYDDGSTPPAWVDTNGVGVVEVAGRGAGEGRRDAEIASPGSGRWRSIAYEGRAGDRIQGWLLGPPDPGPHPLVVWAHGGPEWHVSDRWHPEAAAYVDAGYAVFAPNYRGSTGFGAAFRDAIRGNLGLPESDDLVAAVDHLVATGVADPARIALEGWSWGGYLATLGAGLHPDRWRAVVAGIPVGDSVACHYECDPVNRAWDVAMMGGDPLEVPETYHERNPMTYVDRVRAPMLIVAGERDPRCPLGQIMTYAHALRRRGHPVDVHLYPAGHHAPSVDERVRQVRLILEFLERHLVP
jgi:acetyl esterase/lipase